MTTKHGRIVTCLNGLQPIKSFDTQVVLLDHVTNKTYYIFTNTVPMATKLGRVLTYNGGLLTITA